MDNYSVIRKTLVTEKTSLAKEGKYYFEVNRSASKTSVKRAIESLFGTAVDKVNIIVRKGKEKTFRGNTGIRSDIKIAIVTLKDKSSKDIISKLK